MTEKTVFTQRDVDNAKTKGQVIGWLQGGAAVLLGTLLLGFAGWIPILLLVGVVGYVVFRALLGRSGKREST